MLKPGNLKCALVCTSCHTSMIHDAPTFQKELLVMCLDIVVSHRLINMCILRSSVSILRVVIATRLISYHVIYDVLSCHRSIHFANHCALAPYMHMRVISQRSHYG